MLRSTARQARLLGVAVVLLLGLAAMPPAAGAAGWLPPSTLTTNDVSTYDPLVVVDDAGNATAVWWQYDADADVNTLVSARRPQGGSWGPATTIEAAPAGADAGYVDIDIDGSGNVIALYSFAPTAAESLRSSVRSQSSGSWSTPIEVFPAAGGIPGVPQVAVDDDGNATAIWQRFVLNPTLKLSVMGSTLSAGATSWTTPEIISQAGVNTELPGTSPLEGPQLDVSAAGRTIVAWRSLVAGELVRVSTRRRAAGQTTWTSAVETPSPADQNVTRFALGVAPDGVATIVWLGVSGAANTLQAVAGSAGSSWSAPAELRSTSNPIGAFTLIVDGLGDRTFAFVEQRETGNEINAATRRASDLLWTSPAVVDPAGGANVTQLQGGAASDGSVLLLWNRGGLQTARRSATGAWGAAQNVSVAGTNAVQSALAVEADGDAAAVWTAPDDAVPVDRILAATFDATPPAPGPGPVSIPASGTAGAALAFAAPSTDVWSPVTTTWAFGDGGTATGAAPTHTYSAAGTYVVSITYTDAAGNVATRSGTVVISAPAQPEPPSPPSGPSSPSTPADATTAGPPPSGPPTATPAPATSGPGRLSCEASILRGQLQLRCTAERSSSLKTRLRYSAAVTLQTLVATNPKSRTKQKTKPGTRKEKVAFKASTRSSRRKFTLTFIPAVPGKRTGEIAAGTYAVTITIQPTLGAPSPQIITIKL